MKRCSIKRIISKIRDKLIKFIKFIWNLVKRVFKIYSKKMSVELTGYAKDIDELSSEMILEGLLGHGLFSQKLPDLFTSENFFTWYKEKLPNFEDKGKDYVRYENMRNVNIPRVLSTPNPFAFARLCNALAENWEDNIKPKFIENTINQKHKVSRIHVRKLKDKKHLFEMNYKNFINDENPEQKLAIGKRYYVEADISNCFPSIYSHSIPWALVGKDYSKQKKDAHNEWFNKLDRNIRNTKNEETNGLLIGPHTSNLISEIILTTIDKKLVEKGYEYTRYIDDFKCFVETYEKAEQFLIDLASELKEFELFLNTKKTKIHELPILSVTNWVNKLNNFDLAIEYTENKKEVLKLNRLKAFLDLTTELIISEKNSAIINYTLKVIATNQLGIKACDYYIDYVHHLLLLYPYLTSVIDEFVFEPFKISTTRIKQIAENLYDVGISKKNFEACYFSVFWALKYDFKLEKNISNDAENSRDCVFLTLGAIYSKKYKTREDIKKYKKLAKEIAKNDFDRYWLFLYEILPQPEIKGDYKRIKVDKVSFIKEKYRYNP